MDHFVHYREVVLQCHCIGWCISYTEVSFIQSVLYQRLHCTVCPHVYILYGHMYIYVCRFVTDLALWRPASPEQVERTNTAKSLFFSSVDIQPAATAEEKVQMFKSVLRGEFTCR